MHSPAFKYGVALLVNSNFHERFLPKKHPVPNFETAYDEGKTFAMKERTNIEGWLLLQHKDIYNIRDIDELLEYLTNINED